MTILLRIAAALCGAWGVVGLLYSFRPRGVLSEVEAALLALVAVSHLALGFLLLRAARRPEQFVAIVYAGIALLAGRVVVDLFHALRLPADVALFAIGDLVISFSLLVGILEALPRVLRPPANDPGPPS